MSTSNAGTTHTQEGRVLELVACALQMCIVVIKDDGVSVRWEDKSKSLQSSVWLNSEVCTYVARLPSLHSLCSPLAYSLRVVTSYAADLCQARINILSPFSHAC